MSLTPSPTTLEVYDRAVYEWLGTILVDYGDVFKSGVVLDNVPIFRVMSSPERAFAQIRDMLVADGFIDPPAEGTVDDKASDDALTKWLPFPICRFERQDIFPTELLQNPVAKLRKLASSGLTWKQYNAPKIYEQSYTVDFYALTQTTMNHLSEWVMDQFNNLGAGTQECFITARHPAPYGTLLATVILDGYSDNSDLEADGGKRRIMRKSMSMRVRVQHFDKTPTDVEAIQAIDSQTVTGSLERDLLGKYDALAPVGATLPYTVVYSRNPVPQGHFRAYGTAAWLNSEAGAAFSVSGSQVVEFTALPFRAGQSVQGRVYFGWASEDQTASQSVYFDVVWRNDATDAVTVVSTQTVAPTDSGWVSVAFTSTPPTGYNVGYRIRRSSGPSIRVVVGVTRIVAVTSTNLTTPDTAGSFTRTVTGLIPGNAYIVTARVKAVSGGNPLTLAVYQTATGGSPVSSVAFAQPGEFTFYGTPSAEGVLRLVGTLGTPDAAVVCELVNVRAACPQPV